MSRPAPILAVAEDDVRTLENLMPTLPNHIQSVPDAVATLIVARELGLTPLSTFPDLMVINGTVGMTSKLMLALVKRAGHRTKVITMTDKLAEMEAWRLGTDGEFYEEGVFSFSWEQATEANLANKETYKLYPADMLMNKAIARMTRFAFPDVLRGYVPDEIEDITGIQIEEHAIHLGPTEEVMNIDEVAEVLDAEIVE